jgi:hypothetical protein
MVDKQASSYDAVTREQLKYFEYSHLPEYLQAISKPFCELAYDMEARLYGRELVKGLDKLIEAKDCCVRARLSGGKASD